ncbi:helix-turn-helix domain-containing protein [Aquimarina sp. MMG016]|uniref:helix-turn-helix domain-containing protein n=1 Tax=Aquimarina sp. MMG016 TaxID=2822690 RepID=UPI001B39DF3B|nr:helix-turn-helix domain-containing protein [Aquimarina sp. MMG016]MBQ4819325.1 AraC family transcriptional regulator [Aquimarina sp. MMG016]
MNLLDISPLLSSILGLFLGIFIISRTSGLGSDKRIRYVLSALVFLYAYTSFDYYLLLKLDINSVFSGGAYVLYHLIGPLFYYFILLFTKTEVNLKKGMLILIGYTAIRWTLFTLTLEYNSVKDIIATTDTYGIWFWIEIEYIITTAVNIVLLVLGYLKLKNTPLYLNLDKSLKLNYQWVKIVIILCILLQIISGFNTVLNTDTLENLEFYAKTETLLLAVFFFILAYSIMHFPVFAFTGAFEDLPEVTKKKYAKSSLSDSSELFNQIESMVSDEELYLDYDIKLNTLADKLDKSVHHISQAINQNAQTGFSDYINKYRIEAAKPMLLVPKPNTIFAIALDVGFNSKAAFYTAFRKNTNMTPTEFKKKGSAMK